MNSLRLRYRKVCEDVCCFVGTSVQDPGCLSRIPDPDFLPIPDPKNSTKEKDEKFFSCHSSQKFHKILNNFIFEMLQKKNLAKFSKNYRTFYSKLCHQALKNTGSGSGIRNKPIPYPGSGSSGQKRHRIPDPDLQHW
jgi:hypothetical protein